MPARPRTATATSTAALIREMAAQHHVSYVPTRSELLASDITRLAGDHVRLDEVECLLVALQRAGHLSRNELVHLQARYLSETKPRRSTRSAITRPKVTYAISKE
ncbi:MAG: hypothetical protein QOJ84_4672 [Bradyrhizobium sp.]|nr:hypothetical protein [Bradyrhizobium sp.]